MLQAYSEFSNKAEIQPPAGTVRFEIDRCEKQLSAVHESLKELESRLSSFVCHEPCTNSEGKSLPEPQPDCEIAERLSALHCGLCRAYDSISSLCANWRG